MVNETGLTQQLAFVMAQASQVINLSWLEAEALPITSFSLVGAKA